jgi:phosphate transport system protein
MEEATKAMVRTSLKALLDRDVDKARDVLERDDEVDEINRRVYGLVSELVRREPARVESAIQVLSVFRYLERIADLATNVAEDVIFMVEGEVVRHPGIDRDGRPSLG